MEASVTSNSLCLISNNIGLNLKTEKKKKSEVIHCWRGGGEQEREWRLSGATSVCHHLARHCSRYCLGSHLSGWLAVHNLDQVLW